MNTSDSIVVAIDGPAASGKSTVSRRVAEKLGFVYVDSGALYRGVTWKALREGLLIEEAAVVGMIKDAAWDFFVEAKVVKFAIDGEQPWEQLRSAPVRQKVADIAAMPEVRRFIVEQIRGMTRFGDIVVEGRDIGTVVFPDTSFKYYLDADPEERARRRYRELMQRENEIDLADVMQALNNRDRKDSTRKTAPLQIALGAKVINTTGMSIEQVVDIIVADVHSRLQR